MSSAYPCGVSYPMINNATRRTISVFLGGDNRTPEDQIQELEHMLSNLPKGSTGKRQTVEALVDLLQETEK